MRREKRGRGKRLLRLIVLIFTIFVVGYLLTQRSDSKKFIGFSNSPTPTPNNCPMQKEVSSNGLKNAVLSQLQGNQGTYAVEIINLKTGESDYLNPNRVFGSASLYKLWVMAVVYQEVQEGKINENQILSDSYADLNKSFDIDTDEATKTSGTMTSSVKTALYNMITISDNYSALLLTKKIGESSLSEFLTQNCFNQSKVGIRGRQPTTTAFDIGSFFQKLYNGQLANKKYTAEMIDLLQQQRLTDKLPKYLPYGMQLSLAHKTGELDDFSHDAGIAYTPVGNYIIVVLSQSNSQDLANERIANISKSVFDYFTATPSAAE